MTELDAHTLRRALRTPEDDADTVDIATIVRRGRSLRRRRRFAAVVGGACAAAVLFGALTAIAHLTRPASGPARNPAISGRTAPVPSPSRPGQRESPHGTIVTSGPQATPTATSSAFASPSRTVGGPAGSRAQPSVAPSASVTPTDGVVSASAAASPTPGR